MNEQTRETPAPVANEARPRPKKGGGALLFMLLQLVPVLALGAGAWALFYLHGQYQKKESVERAEEVAQYELRRMTALMNYRLNELREEMMHLYGEQSNLARALNEAERERLVFFRREHLAAYAVLVPDGQDGKWELQKYYLRETAPKANEQREAALKIFREVVAEGKPFALRRVDSRTYGATWPSGDAFAVAFSSSDEGGKPFGLVAVFRPSYVFPFCRFFTDQLGAMPVAAFVLDDRGFAVCHSQARYDGSNFKEYKLYGAITGALGSGNVGSARYTNITGTEVSAVVKRVEPGGLVLVSEAAEIGPWSALFPTRELTIIGAGILVVTLLGALLTALAVARRLKALSSESGGRAPSPASGGEVPFALPASDGLGLELSEFTKLKRELKEMETAVLDLQMMQAFVAGFQKAATELPLGQDLPRFMLEYLKAWNVPLFWLKWDPKNKSLASGGSVHWRSEVPAFELRLDESPLRDNDPELRRKISERVRDTDLRLQFAFFLDEVLGVLVIGEAGKFPGGNAEMLPQILQIHASTSKARVPGPGGSV